MTVSSDFKDYVHDQLRLLPCITSRRMFGGIGLYSGGVFFALIAQDTLYFKVDDSNRPDYVQRGARAFKPFPDKPAMGYYEVPSEVLEDVEELACWARRSVAVALTAAHRQALRGRTATQGGASVTKRPVRPVKKRAPRL
jgi:DNA transformation protein and related proteins